MKAKLSQIIEEAPGIKSFRLEVAQKRPYAPGQWMTVRMGEEKRDFSISSSPTEEGMQFTTKLSNSSFKRKLWQMQPGEEMEIERTAGSFILETTDARPRLFLAGGIGITPLRSMAKYVFDQQLNLPITLLYSVKTPVEAVFAEELAKIPQVKLVLTVTEKEIKNWTGEKGRINQKLINKYCPEWGSRTWWVCGAPKMVAAVTELGLDMGVKPEMMKSEEFSGY